jgi:4-hydroxythreonine-4-phosphate dehydrogenase
MSELTPPRRPVLALTTGDPAGVGPEISVRAACEPAVCAAARLLLLGDACVLGPMAERFCPGVPVVVHSPAGVRTAPAPDTAVIEIVDMAALAAPVPMGAPTAEGGAACYRYITEAIDMARRGAVDGVVTAPISKSALRKAGIDFPGHTEIFGEFTHTASYAMMMYSERLAVGLVTCHQSLASVPGALTTARIVEVGGLLHRAVARIRGAAPRMAVLGLNPHAGEDGLFGREEIDVVAPAVAALRAAGIDAHGPYPPDTAFTPHMLARHGAHLCLYHDQGLIPFKMMAFDEGVNVTMGLPFPRTSVDHGTAYDIAGQGVARIESLVEAILLGARLA